MKYPRKYTKTNLADSSQSMPHVPFMKNLPEAAHIFVRQLRTRNEIRNQLCCIFLYRHHRNSHHQYIIKRAARDQWTRRTPIPLRWDVSKLKQVSLAPKLSNGNDWILSNLSQKKMVRLKCPLYARPAKKISMTRRHLFLDGTTKLPFFGKYVSSSRIHDNNSEKKEPRGCGVPTRRLRECEEGAIYRSPDGTSITTLRA